MKTTLLGAALAAASLIAGPAPAGTPDGSANYGPYDGQAGSPSDATPGTTRAQQRSPCERLAGKEKESCLKKPAQIGAGEGASFRGSCDELEGPAKEACLHQGGSVTTSSSVGASRHDAARRAP